MSRLSALLGPLRSPLPAAALAMLAAHALGALPFQLRWADALPPAEDGPPALADFLRLLTVSPTLRYGGETGWAAAAAEAWWAVAFVGVLTALTRLLVRGAPRGRAAADLTLQYALQCAYVALAPFANLLALAITRAGALSAEPGERGDAARDLLTDAGAWAGHAVVLGLVGALTASVVAAVAAVAGAQVAGAPSASGEPEADAGADVGKEPEADTDADEGPEADAGAAEKPDATTGVAASSRPAATADTTLPWSRRILGPPGTRATTFGVSVLAAGAGLAVLLLHTQGHLGRIAQPALEFWCRPAAWPDVCAGALRDAVILGIPDTEHSIVNPLLERLILVYAAQAFLLAFVVVHAGVRRLLPSLPGTARTVLATWAAYTAGSILYAAVLERLIDSAGAATSPVPSAVTWALHQMVTPAGLPHAVFGAPLAAGLAGAAAAAYARVRRAAARLSPVPPEGADPA